MRKISADEIEDGMILGEDLAGPNGNIILPKGVSLKGALSSRLQGWGIKELIVEGEEASNQVEEHSEEDYRNHLESLFVDGLEPTTNKILFNALLEVKGRR